MAAEWVWMLLSGIVFLAVIEIQADTIRVTTVLNPPYVKQTGQQLEGLHIDILNILKERLNVNFTISPVSDGRYGAFDPGTGTWTGMIGELYNNMSDLAIGPITATSLRSRIVDFTQPVANGGIRMLVRPYPSDYFEIDTLGVMLQPFATEVWLTIIVAYVLVSVIFFVIARFNPSETCGQADQKLPVTTSFFMMFSMLSLQGFRLTPASASGRILVCFWWMFVICILMIYTANLPPFLSKPFSSRIRMNMPVSSFADLPEQTELRYGTLIAGSTLQYFRTSKMLTDQKIYSYLKRNKYQMRTTSDGLKEVQTGRYAFIMESESAYYQAAHRCDLKVTGEMLSDMSFAFACQKNSGLCATLDTAILSIKEDGTLRRLTNEWMSGPCGKYTDISMSGFPTSTTEEPTEETSMRGYVLNIRSFAVPLIALSIGIVVCLVVMVVEILCNRSKSGGGKPDEAVPLET